MLEASNIFGRMNEWGKQKKPFFFLIDFMKNQGEIFPLSEPHPEIQFDIDSEPEPCPAKVILKKYPISLEAYRPQFDFVQKNILRGNSYLANLTCSTPIEINLSLGEIYRYARARYKMYWKGNFVCFSPETFIRIQNGKIYSYPMKGTIDASVAEAAAKILSDEKEMAEHYTIVDLIRNDLSQVAKKVKVERFRYIDGIQTHEKKILQVSSEISGELPADFHTNLGGVFEKLLPAGSICGAPKKKTVEIILEAEQHYRNFYTGVFGVFDGENLDSAVMIRFIENTENGLVFKSGGGITHQSEAEKEYEEMIQKVYVPIY
ncbi:MAG: aminodeoxychorismate synthase component I [Moheibacter sp.]